MRNLSTGLLATLLACVIMASPVAGQDMGGNAEAGTGADAVDAGTDATGDANDASRFDPGWIGLAGLLGLAGLMGRNHRQNTVSGTTPHR
jgi:hypothetical protein